jgi:hypothetical protein
MANRRVGGIIEISVNGTTQSAKGNWTYDLGVAQREAVVGSDAVHGYKETPKVAFIEGEITDNSDLDSKQFQETTEATVFLTLANGKNVVLRDAWYAGDGTTGTEEGNMNTRFEGPFAEEI